MNKLYALLKWAWPMIRGREDTPQTLKDSVLTLMRGNAIAAHENQQMAELLFVMLRAKGNDGVIDPVEWKVIEERAWKMVKRHASNDVIMRNIVNKVAG